MVKHRLIKSGSVEAWEKCLGTNKLSCTEAVKTVTRQKSNPIGFSTRANLTRQTTLLSYPYSYLRLQSDGCQYP